MGFLSGLGKVLGGAAGALAKGGPGSSVPIMSDDTGISGRQPSIGPRMNPLETLGRRIFRKRPAAQRRSDAPRSTAMRHR